MALQLFYPKSFLKLLLIGFALAMLPLLFAFGNAALYLDRLAEQSRSTVAQAIQATRASRVLVEQLTVMERSARQFFVLHDQSLLDNFQHAHQRFNMSMRQLATLPLSQQQLHLLSNLAESESTLYSEIVGQAAEPNPPEGLIARFVGLSDQAQGILAENNRLIDRESAILSQAAERTQKMLLWQSLTLLPVAFLVALVITFLVAQPIRRMDAAIRRLGEGQYAESISIDGPGDLRTLGERLDWLRQQRGVAELTTSVCTGAFLLGAAGLLDGLRATSHWSTIERLRGFVPGATVLDNERVVDEGEIITSAGVSAGIDMALHVVRRLHGDAAAINTARDMEYDWALAPA